MMVFPVTQIFPRPVETDILGRVRHGLPALLPTNIAGKRVGIGISSRGIKDYLPIVQATVGLIKERGGIPIVFPAAGSHGGATAEGQRETMRDLHGITSESIGAELNCCMEVTQIAQLGELDLMFSSVALSCDYFLLLPRVKPHTEIFRQPTGSGIIKMLVIGCAKQAGAEKVHALALYRGDLGQTIRFVGERLLPLIQHRFLGALAIVENAYHDVAEITAVRGAEVWDKEPEIYSRAAALMPRLPVKHIDLAVIWQVGKVISGEGFDPNVTGPPYFPRRDPENDEWPIITRTVLLRLLGHNGICTNRAWGVTQKLFDAVNWPETEMNAKTANRPELGGKPERIFSSDRELLQAASADFGEDPRRIVIFKDTLSLGQLLVTGACLPELRGNSSYREQPFELPFDAEGNLQMTDLFWR